MSSALEIAAVASLLHNDNSSLGGLGGLGGYSLLLRVLRVLYIILGS